MQEVRLEWAEVHRAACEGVRRRIGALQHGRNGRFGIGEDHLWANDIVGIIGEYAVCKSLDKFWSPAVGTLDYEGDVGEGIQVRSTTRLEGRLIVHPEDKPDHYFFLAVLFHLPVVKLYGPILADECKKPEFWWEPPNGRPAYFVPQHYIEEAGHV